MSEIMVRASLAAASGVLIRATAAPFRGEFLHQYLGRQFGVFPHQGLDPRLVFKRERLYDAVVLFDRRAEPARHRKGRYAKAFELLHYVVGEGAEPVVIACLQECLVEPGVEPKKSFEVVLFGAGLHLLVQGAKPLYVLIGELRARLPRGVTLEQALDGVELAHVFGGYGAYDRTFSWHYGYEALGFELPERLPYGGAAYAEAFGYLVLRHSFAGLEPAVCYGVFDEFHDPFPQGNGFFERPVHIFMYTVYQLKSQDFLTCFRFLLHKKTIYY